MECAYIGWVDRFFRYAVGRQEQTHPRVDSIVIRDYLTPLATHQHILASPQNQEFCALLFLCREVLGVEPDGLASVVLARQGVHLPVVLSVPEVAALLDAMRGTPRLMATLIYGGSLRVFECCELRVKDIDFDQSLIHIGAGKGDQDRSTLLPQAGREQTRQQLHAAEAQYRGDRLAELAGVWMPDALEREYPKAGTELGWFWVFPSQSLSIDPRAGIVRRHHVSDSVIQKAVKAAARDAHIYKPVSVHALRYGFATHLLLNGVDIRQVQEYLGPTRTSRRR